MKIYLWCFLPLIFGCSKLGDDLRFDNYTHRNNAAFQTGGNGKDWKLNEDFNRKVNGLFNTSKNSVCEFEANVEILGYPNPAGEILIIRWFDIDYDFAEFVLVDKKLNILSSSDFDSSIGETFALNVSNLGAKRARLFYKFYKNDCELRGYGNVFITE